MRSAKEWKRIKRWHRRQVGKYAGRKKKGKRPATRGERSHYIIYAEALGEVLERARRQCEVMGFVQVRAKSVPTFAEKAIRKIGKYDDPAHQLTDLCGARVITETQAEVDRIRRFIQENFRVDEANSQDVRTRLKAEEFGYGAFHYVVQIRKDRPLVVDVLKELGKREHTDVLKEIGGRKAEIQVCTLLQHAWAAISHDRIYKVDFKVPERLRRQLARVAALLENADEEFAQAVEALDAYKRSYDAYTIPKQRRDEIEEWEMVLEHDADNAELAHRIARLAITLEDWDEAIKVLSPFSNSKKTFILSTLGLAKNKADLDGRPELQAALDRDPTDADALCALADTWVNVNASKALEFYERAFQAAPTDPRVLARYLEGKVKVVGNVDFISLVHPSLEAAIARCQELASLRIYLPWAFYDIATFALLLNRPYESLAAYARAVTLSESAQPIERALESVTAFEQPILDSIARMPELADLDWALEAARRFLRVAKVVKLKQLAASATEKKDKGAAEEAAAEAEEARRELKGLVAKSLRDIKRPVVFVAGGCDPSVERDMKSYRKDLEAAFKGFTGTIFCGGTTAGISGVVGDLTLGSSGGIQSIAYLPYALPRGLKGQPVEVHPAYETYVTSDIIRGAAPPKRTTEFTPLEPIQTWIDLIAAGVRPSKVRVLGINGGPITAFEYRTALAFGAAVAIVESSGRSASELRRDAGWWPPPALIWVPRDVTSLRAFVNPGRPRMSARQITRAGKVIHRRFLKDNRYKNIDPTMLPWPKLGEYFRESNRQQAAYAVHILRAVGYGVRPATGRVRYPRFTRGKVEIMAEMEHGRWIVERLSKGEQYGPRRDPKEKTSPYLVPWKDLPDHIKKYDRDIVRDFPLVLEKAGLEVYRLTGRRSGSKPARKRSRRTKRKGRK